MKLTQKRRRIKKRRRKTKTRPKRQKKRSRKLMWRRFLRKWDCNIKEINKNKIRKEKVKIGKEYCTSMRISSTMKNNYENILAMLDWGKKKLNNQT